MELVVEKLQNPWKGAEKWATRWLIMLVLSHYIVTSIIRQVSALSAASFKKWCGHRDAMLKRQFVLETR